MAKTLAAFGFLLMVGVLSPAPQAGAQEEALRWAQRMTDGQVLEVRGIVGEIRAVPASGTEASVVARKVGDEDDFSEVAVEVAEARGRIVICAVYGSWNHGKGRCDPDAQWQDEERPRRRNQSIDVDVEYEVRVPEGVKFEGTMVSGGVYAEELRSDLVATTVSGPIRLSTSLGARAQSVSGDMEIRVGAAGTEDMDFQTVSGDITLWLPRNVDADVTFNSLSGDFDTDFDLTGETRRGRWIGTNLRGTLGTGGRDLSLQTVSGDVRLRRGQG